MCGWTEVLNFSLCSIDDISKKLRKDNILDFVKISNPKTTEFQVFFKYNSCNVVSYVKLILGYS